MKMTLENKISRSLEILSNCDFHDSMRSNDKIVVFYSSAMLGSRLSKRDNDILMGRNTVPKSWYTNSVRSDCKINLAFKKAHSQIVEYLERGYNITPGRVYKLLDILSYGQQGCSKVKNDLSDNAILHRYLRNLNDLKMYCNEMTESEIYDFSFDMVFDFLDKLSLSISTLSLSFLIMYWIQRESGLIPLAVACMKDDFLAALDTKSGDSHTEKETKKKFRFFMRKLLDLHLKMFIKKASKEGEKVTSRDRILKLVIKNPKHTAKTMASCLGLSVQAIQKQITILKTEKRLKRVGPDNGGYWKVLSEK